MALEENDLKQISALIAASQADTQKTFEAMLEPVTQTLSQEIATFVTEQTTALEARLGATPSAPDASPDTAVSARLAKLEIDLKAAVAARETAESDRQRSESRQALSREISGFNPLHSAEVQDLLAARFGDLQAKEGAYLLKNGQTLTEAVQGFFGSDAGKHFLPAVQGGAGTPAMGANTQSGNKPDLDQLLNRAFTG
jgi:hypothetical protein